MVTNETLEEVRARQQKLADLIQEIRELKSGNSHSGVSQIVMAHPDSGERAAHRVEKYFVAMVVLNVCLGVAFVLNWITDKDQSHQLNAIYMMAPHLKPPEKKEIEQ